MKSYEVDIVVSELWEKFWGLIDGEEYLKRVPNARQEQEEIADIIGDSFGETINNFREHYKLSEFANSNVSELFTEACLRRIFSKFKAKIQKN